MVLSSAHFGQVDIDRGAERRGEAIGRFKHRVDVVARQVAFRGAQQHHEPRVGVEDLQVEVPPLVIDGALGCVSPNKRSSESSNIRSEEDVACPRR